VTELVGIFLGYRKLTVMLCLFVVAVLFRVEGLIDGGQFVDLLKGTVLGYFGGNAVEHFSAVTSSTLKAFIPSAKVPAPETIE